MFACMFVVVDIFIYVDSKTMYGTYLRKKKLYIQKKFIFSLLYLWIVSKENIHTFIWQTPKMRIEKHAHIHSLTEIAKWIYRWANYIENMDMTRNFFFCFVDDSAVATFTATADGIMRKTVYEKKNLIVTWFRFLCNVIYKPKTYDNF